MQTRQNSGLEPTNLSLAAESAELRRTSRELRANAAAAVGRAHDALADAHQSIETSRSLRSNVRTRRAARERAPKMALSYFRLCR